MFSSIKIVLAALFVAFSTPGFAQSSGTGIGTGVASASANVDGGKSYSFGGSVGAAQCANAFNILGVGASMSDTGCELVMASTAGYQSGLTTKAEARAIYFAGIKHMGVTLKAKPAASTMSSKSVSTSKPAKGPLMSYNGEFAKFSKKVQADILECRVLYNNKQIEDCVGKY